MRRTRSTHSCDMLPLEEAVTLEIRSSPASMDKPTNYMKCYAILGIFPDDDWATVRNAYQRQIRRWHPDRFQNRMHQELAEEKTKELNYAYHELNNYHRQYGVLPPDGTSSRTAQPVPQDNMVHFSDETHFQSTDNWIDTSLPYTEPETPKRNRFGDSAVVITFLAFAFLVWGEQFFMASEYQESVSSVEVDVAKQDKNIPMELFARQSVHENTTTRVGNSARTSRQDKSRNQANEFTSSTLSPDQSTLGSIATGKFGNGSSKSEVLAVQGPPLRQTEHVWYYGTSRIYFRNGKVTGWYESPSNPIAINRDAGSKPENDPSNSASTLPGVSTP
jgi:hypothetical protein